MNSNVEIPSKTKQWFKVAVTVGIPVLGILIPLWIWQSDTNAHSLQTRLTSMVELQESTATKMGGVSLSVGGVQVESPYLSTIRIEANGSKPIIASDFESPIQFVTQKSSQVAKAVVSATEPSGLKAEISISQNSFALKPLLLNPGDVIKIAVITSGDAPVFAPTARIAGVSRLKLDDDTPTRNKVIAASLWICLALTSMVAYSIFAAAFFKPAVVLLNRAHTLLALVLASGVWTMCYQHLFEMAEVEPTFVWRMIITLVCAAPVFCYMIYIRPHKRSAI
jgi:hypothetical protein